MSKLDEAEQRLQRAVAGLEEAARAVASSAQSSASAAPAEPDPQIAAALESAQTRNSELEAANAAVAQRLDGAIARIKSILKD